jgi:hypothetical protein
MRVNHLFGFRFFLHCGRPGRISPQPAVAVAARSDLKTDRKPVYYAALILPV